MKKLYFLLPLLSLAFNDIFAQCDTPPNWDNPPADITLDTETFPAYCPGINVFVDPLDSGLPIDTDLSSANTGLADCDIPGSLVILSPPNDNFDGDPCFEEIDREWIAQYSDANLEFASWNQLITIEDNTIPIIDVTPPDINEEGCIVMDVENFTPLGFSPFPSSVNQGAFIGEGGNAFDNCTMDADLTFTYQDNLIDNAPSDPCLIIEREWIAVDVCGNESDPVTQLINLSDLTDPTITCPIDVRFEVRFPDFCDEFNPDIFNISGFPYDPGPAFLTDPMSEYPDFASNIMDNCPLDDVVMYYEDAVTHSGSCIDNVDNVVFQITRTWTVEDACGRTSSCDQLIELQDFEGPILLDAGGSPYGDPRDFFLDQNAMGFDFGPVVNCPISVLWTEPIAGVDLVDNCDLNPMFVSMSPPIDLSSNTTIDYEFMDACGNTTLVSFEVLMDCQDCTPGGSGTLFDRCDSVDPLCDISAFNLSSCTPDYVLGSGASETLCGGFGVHNAAYIPFIAGEVNVVFTVEPFACSPGDDATGIGIQAVVTDLCDAGECYGGNGGACFANSQTFTATGLEPGNAYQIVIDGCSGSVCSFNLSIDSAQPFEIEQPDTPVQALEDPTFDIDECMREDGSTIVCPGSIINFFPSNFQDAMFSFCWSIDSTNGVNCANCDNNCQTATPGSPAVCGADYQSCGPLSLEFTLPGSYNVCLLSLDNGCDDLDVSNFCFDIVVDERPPTLFDPVNLCYEDVEFGWAVDVEVNNFPWDSDEEWIGPDINLSQVTPGDPPTIVTTPAIDDCGCMYEQQIPVQVWDSEIVEVKEVEICISDLTSYYDPVFDINFDDIIDGGGSYFPDFDIIENTTIFGGSENFNYNGIACDTQLTYQFIVYEAIGEVVAPSGCTVVASFDIDEDEFPDFMFDDDIMYSWWDGTDGGSASTFETSNPGTGTLELSYFLPDGSQCLLGTYTFPIVIDNVAPPPPTITSSLNFCSNELDNVVFTAPPPGMGVSYEWSITGPAAAYTEVSASNTTDTYIISITDPTAALGVELIQIAAGTMGCDGTSSPATGAINIVDTPIVEAMAPMTACLGDAVLLSVNVLDGAPTTYSWDLNPASQTIVNADGSSIEGVWSTSGLQNYTLTATDANGCMSNVFTGEILIVDPLAAPTNDQCNTTSTTVEISWDADADATGYSVNVLSGQTGTLTGNSFSVIGLAMGEEVMIEVVAQGGPPCGDSAPTTFSCEASDCDINVNLSLSDPSLGTICLDGTEAPFQIISTETGGTWSGTGADATGMFDPSVGAGSYTITHEVSDAATGCSDSGDITIQVVDLPSATLNGNPTACVDENVMITADVGAQNIVAYNWDFGPATNDATTTSNEVTASWPGSGVFNYSLTVENAEGCTSGPITGEITIDAGLAMPTGFDCNSNSSTVTITWDNDANADSYSVNVLSGQTGTLNGNSYEVTGLTQGETVMVEVTAQGSSACGNSGPATFNCAASNCTLDVQLSLSDPALATVCLDANATPFFIFSTETGGVWDGPGVDPTTGEFDPVAAGPGEHTISHTVTDLALMCSDDDDIIIQVFELPEPTFILANNEGCLNDLIPITIDADGLEYTMDAGPNGTFPNGTAANTFEVSFDASGEQTIVMTAFHAALPDCSATFTAAVNIFPALSDPAINCFPDVSSIDFSWTPVDNVTDYIVTVGNSPSVTISDTTIDAVGLSENEEISITVEAVDPNGCMNTMDMDLCAAISCPSYSVNVSLPTNTFCIADFTTPIVPMVMVVNDDTGMEVPATGEWSGTADIDPITGEFLPSTTGQFTLTFNYSDPNNCGGTGATIVDVSNVDNPMFMVTNPLLCLGDTLQVLLLNPDANAIYNFDVAPLVDSPSGEFWFETSVGGPQSIMGQASIGSCMSGMEVIDLVVNEPFDVMFNNPSSVCVNVDDPIDLSAVDPIAGTPVQGTWVGNGITPDGNFVPLEGDSIYTFSFIEANCGVEISTQLEVVVKPTINIPVIDITACVDSMIMFEIQSDFIDELAYIGDAPPLNQIGGSLLGTYTTAGNFTYQSYIDRNGCNSDTVEWNVTIIDSLILPIEPMCIATTSSIFLDWEEIDCVSSYTILVNDQPSIGTITDSELLIEDLGQEEMVVVDISFENDCGCGNKAFTIVCETLACPDATADFSNNQTEYCSDDLPAALALEVMYSGDGLTGLGTTEWSGPGAAPDGTVDVSLLAEGINTFYVNYTEGDCMYLDSLQISQGEQPSFSFVSTNAACFENPLGTLIVSDVVAVDPYVIALDNGTDVVAGEVVNLPVGFYTLSVTDANSCISTASVVVSSAPTADVEISDDINFLYVDSLGQWNINTNLTQIDSIVWTNNGTAIPCALTECLDLIYSPTDEGENELCANVYYGSQCVEQACTTFDSEFFEIRSWFIPNIMDIDSDLPQDQTLNMYIEGFDIAVSRVEVYDRWGNQVHINEELRDTPEILIWDGKWNGSDVVPGVYVYMIELTINGTQQIIADDVTIIR